jgi:hypothetical protein
LQHLFIVEKYTFVTGHSTYIETVEFANDVVVDYARYVWMEI